jgi:hypothetical protein
MSSGEGVAKGAHRPTGETASQEAAGAVTREVIATPGGASSPGTSSGRLAAFFLSSWSNSLGELQILRSYVKTYGTALLEDGSLQEVHLRTAQRGFPQRRQIVGRQELAQE